MTRIRWADVLERAAGIVESYDTGVTVRQLYYLLVAEEMLPNLQPYYRRLSAQTAAARREGWFPDLIDRTSRIERFLSFDGPQEARDYLRNLYRRDRSAGQGWTVILGVEKDGMSAQLDAWFTDPLGIPHVAAGGYPSQSLVDEVRRDIEAEGRPAVLIFAGDWDPSGIDIPRDLDARVGVFDEVVRVGLSPDQVEEFEIPFNPDPEVARKLERDPRAARFRQANGGRLVQYELDALAPEVLRNLYWNAIGQFWDASAFEAVLRQEEAERAELEPER
jgi:hypothetical protein